MADKNTTKLLSKKDLRTRGWTHRQIRDLGPSDKTIKTGSKGRPAFGYPVSLIERAERARA